MKKIKQQMISEPEKLIYFLRPDPKLLINWLLVKKPVYMIFYKHRLLSSEHGGC